MVGYGLFGLHIRNVTVIIYVSLLIIMFALCDSLCYNISTSSHLSDGEQGAYHDHVTNWTECERRHCLQCQGQT